MLHGEEIGRNRASQEGEVRSFRSLIGLAEGFSLVEALTILGISSKYPIPDNEAGSEVSALFDRGKEKGKCTACISSFLCLF